MGDRVENIDGQNTGLSARMPPNSPLPPSSQSWAQPSLSRDFALLSVAIILVMLLISAWVAWITYVKHSDRIASELEKEADRIERTLETEVQGAAYLLHALGEQIAVSEGAEAKTVAQLIRPFASGNPKYALWSWSDAGRRIVASSNKGVLETPIDVADRDYLQQSESDPWKLHIGMPIEGRLSGRWIIPIAIGVSDRTGKFLGTLMVSVDIQSLSEEINHLVKREGISFAILSRNFVTLTAVSERGGFLSNELPPGVFNTLNLKENPSGIISRPGLLSREGIHAYYRVSDDFPYIIVVGYSGAVSDVAIRNLLWPRLIQIMVVAGFLLSFLWIIRARVIKPVMELGSTASMVAGGGPYTPPAKTGPQEIEFLGEQIARLSHYLSERRRVEEELRDRIAGMMNRLQNSRMEARQRAALLSGLLAEYKQVLRNINAYAQVMKDQIYGPIENKKYKQYAADIHQAGTMLELMVRKLIALSRVDAGALLLREEICEAGEAVEATVLQSRELLPAGISIAAMTEGLENVRLRLDGLLFQQALLYLVLYMAGCAEAEMDGSACAITLEGRSLRRAEGEMQPCLILSAHSAQDAPPEWTSAALFVRSERVEIAMHGMESESAEGEARLRKLHLSLAMALLSQCRLELFAMPREATDVASFVYVIPLSPAA